jgi:hypothetical protein
VLLQTLISIVIIVLLSGALFTGTLISAKVALHESATRHVQLALARGTDDFTRWAANSVYRNHANAQWPSNLETTVPQPLCDSTQPTEPATCELSETSTYRVTGSTTNPMPRNSAVYSAQDKAENLQTTVDEQRISAEVTSTVTTAAGAVLGTGTRELTLRVFDVPPWAIVTGTRDLSSVLGSLQSTEGDTGGVRPLKFDQLVKAPDPSHPGAYTDTAISVTMTCANSALNSDEQIPLNDNRPPGNNDMPWGVQAIRRAFEAPCQPQYGLAADHPAPADAEIPDDGDYDVSSFASPMPWANGDATGTWPGPQ